MNGSCWVMQRALVQHEIEPVAIDAVRNMDLDSQALATESAGQRVGNSLTDVVGVIVSEDMQASKIIGRLEGLETACRERGPNRDPDHLMRSERCLDTLGNTEFPPRLVQSDGAAADRVDRRHRLLSRVDRSIINPLDALELAVGTDNRRDDRGEMSDRATLFIEVWEVRMSSQRWRGNGKPTPREIVLDEIRPIGFRERALH
jgi:hypothetical protein